MKYIDLQKDYFPQAKADQLNGIALQEFSAKQFKKSREQDDPGMIKLKLTAAQAFEDKVDDLWGFNGYITSILAYDSNFEYYVIHMFGRTDVCEGDTFEAYCLPISTGGFDNVAGGTTNVIYLLACYMK